ncbi:SNF2 family N-terminal domain-containing protein [Epithele typhae]|uniref:SNF2 family N-terminal domain-containing protein n=1 Tax=Epithele typhae TaxID=378194 RepID=UPI0020075C27|nr:SNF2 family N-terminal domain-containing protein [Epithele typhae]KAH9914362.1 SNF2 family N-terminal domain-containing protein [Epithele typhae]
MSHTPSSRSTASSPGAAIPSTRATSPPSSPGFLPETKSEADSEVQVVEDPAQARIYAAYDAETSQQESAQRLQQLESLLQRSGTYVKLLKEQMDLVRVKHAKKPKPATKPKSKADTKPKSTRKRGRVVSDSEDEREPKRAKADDAEAAKEDEGKEKPPAFEQPALITGATLKDYQLEGVAWMAGLHQNGISGILADEMGLGKTIQTIAFHAFLRERTAAPFMVVCPLAVLDNWAREFSRFAPDIPFVVYYGSKEERAELRRKEMVMDAVDVEYYNEAMKKYGAKPASSSSKSKGKGKAKGKSKTKAKPKGKGKVAARGRAAKDDYDSEDEKPKARGKVTVSGKRSIRSRRHAPEDEADSDEFENSMVVDEGIPPPAEQRNKRPLKPHQRTNFPVVITTYQVVINDRAELAKYHWGFIVVDEGHRLKNIDCVLMREIKRLPSDARMVLTGTPLQNNLSELWSLLNFVLPDIFGDLSTFQAWFDEGRLKSRLNSEREAKLIHSLHDILRPFLLRRMKADVEMKLPPKKEYVLYTPLSERQRALYDIVVQGDKTLRLHLINELERENELVNGSGRLVEDVSDEEEPLMDAAREKARVGRGLREKTGRTYEIDSDAEEDEDEDAYFRRLAEEQLRARKAKKSKANAELGREWQRREAIKEVSNLNLKNVIMQLRKVCQHPFLFHWPKDPKTRESKLDEELVTASGKMMVLERLLDALFTRGHKVLLFSQFTTMLDIIEDWAKELKGWEVCRIDGSMKMVDRRDDIQRFQDGGDSPDAPRLFLLSTRSGGLGLNLVAADTVIFYDQDWNPQADLQAQDRAHRIGQTRPVLIFRLLCAHTVETKIMQRATEKRKLEAVVIAKGEFVNPTLAASANKRQALAELAMELHRLEGEQIEVVPDTAAGKASVISDADLDMLLDRRPEVFVDRQKGWASAAVVDGQSAKKAAVVGGHAKTAFAVYEAPAQVDGNLLGMMEADEDEDD